MILSKEKYRIFNFFLSLLFTFCREIIDGPLKILYKEKKNDKAGFPVVFPEYCESCFLCVDLCPSSAIACIGNQGEKCKSLLINEDLCIQCSYCIHICPTKSFHYQSAQME